MRPALLPVLLLAACLPASEAPLPAGQAPPPLGLTVTTGGVVPSSVLTWQEEQVRFAFQNGQAAFMRNWPYAASLMSDPAASRVAGRYAVAAMPAGVGGNAAAALGGSTLAVNAFTTQADTAQALVEYLTAPAQMRERAQVLGQLPPREQLYADPDVQRALPIEPATARSLVARAVSRPVTPVYAELSEILQIQLHRVLTRQEEPSNGLRLASEAMRRVLRRAGLGGT